MEMQPLGRIELNLGETDGVGASVRDELGGYERCKRMQAWD